MTLKRYEIEILVMIEGGNDDFVPLSIPIVILWHVIVADANIWSESDPKRITALT